MKKIRIIIVESDTSVALRIKKILLKLDCLVPAVACSAEQALDFVDRYQPHLVFLGVTLSDESDSIIIGKVLREQFHVPFVFIIRQVNIQTIENAMSANPYGYLLSPFEEKNVLLALKLAVTSHQNELDMISSGKLQLPERVIGSERENFFVRDKGKLVRVKFCDLMWIQAEGNYTLIFVRNGKYLMRSSMKEIEARLPGRQFVRIHKSYLVNMDFVTGVDAHHVFIDKTRLSIGRAYQKALLSRINFL